MKVVNFTPIEKAKPHTLKEREVICNCGCKTKFMKIINGNYSLQTRHYLNAEHYREFIRAKRRAEFNPKPNARLD